MNIHTYFKFKKNLFLNPIASVKSAILKNVIQGIPKANTVHYSEEKQIKCCKDKIRYISSYKEIGLQIRF